MATPTTAELSSISSTLDELTGRIGDLAERLSATGEHDLAYELFEIERSLTPGMRRLNKLIYR